MYGIKLQAAVGGLMGAQRPALVRLMEEEEREEDAVKGWCQMSWLDVTKRERNGAGTQINVIE